MNKKNKEKSYYLYALVDTSEEVNIKTDYGIIKNKPFYIGKGSNLNNTNKRYLIHKREALAFKNINPHKERKIRNLLKNNNFGYQIIMRENYDLVNEEISLIKQLGRKSYDKKGILTNISEGGTGGYVWKDNKIAVENIRKANENRWKGINNPNSSLNKDFKQTPSHKSFLTGKHWNKGAKRTLYSVIDKDSLKLIIKGDIYCISKFLQIKSNTVSSKSSKIVKSKYILVNEKLGVIKINNSLYNYYLEHGIVRSTCIILKKKKEYVEISRNDLSIVE